MAQVLPVAVEHLARFNVVLVGAQAFQCTVGQLAATHAVFGALDQFQDAGNRLVQRAGGDQAHQVGDLHRVVVLVSLLVGDAEGGEVGRRTLGLPHRLDRGQLHLLVFAGGVTALVTQHDHRQR